MTCLLCAFHNFIQFVHFWIKENIEKQTQLQLIIVYIMYFKNNLINFYYCTNQTLLQNQSFIFIIQNIFIIFPYIKEQNIQQPYSSLIDL